MVRFLTGQPQLAGSFATSFASSSAFFAAYIEFAPKMYDWLKPVGLASSIEFRGLRSGSPSTQG